MPERAASNPVEGVREYYAHSSGSADRSTWQRLTTHLHQVADLAAERAAVFDAAALARVQGLLHDLGKYTAEFQRRLDGDPRKVDHSSAGAKVALDRFGDLGYLLAYGIAGHHAGLANGLEEGERTPLALRVGSGDWPRLDSAWQEEIPLPGELSALPLKRHANRPWFQRAFFSRMLFSCLVDADFIDTEAYYLGVEGKASAREMQMPSLQALREQLSNYLGKLPADGEVNSVREGILQHVRANACLAPGLFSLTVPTGGGKTLASLAFALDHAVAHGLRRVIFVIPFTSVVEQNAAVFRRALGELGERAVLEHHSAFQEKASTSAPDAYQAREKLRLAMENWDAPIVVTTAVQFFESLFAARPSRCRKLHNIAGSVVILDEAQTFPLPLLRPCVAAIDELARNYRASVVLCTATQPALNAPGFSGGLEGVRELAPEPPRLYQQLERVRVRHAGTLDDEQLAERLRQHEQVLCIVNNRRHARAVYEALPDLPGAMHLTTLMCAKHRSEVLDRVRQRLRDRLPCRVIATSLIEAGVDVDFPVVYRAEAGLDSIAQAAGRCNREGRRSIEASEVWVFGTANDEWKPPAELRQFAEAGQEVLRQYGDAPLSPNAVQAYFELLYWKRGDTRMDLHGLLPLLEASRLDSLPFEVLEHKFRMIDDSQVAIVIPFDDVAQKALRDLRFASGSVGIARTLQPYIVQVPQRVCLSLRQAGAVQPVEPEKWGEQFLELVNESLYSRDFGLHWDNPSFLPAESTVI